MRHPIRQAETTPQSSTYIQALRRRVETPDRDATRRHVRTLADWVAFLNLPLGEVSLADADAFAHLQTCPRQKLRFVGHHPLRRPHHPRITGTFDVPDISGNIYFAFRYNVVRV